MWSCFPTCTHLPSRSCRHRPYLLQPSEPWSRPQSVPSRQKRNSEGSVWSVQSSFCQPLAVVYCCRNFVYKIMPSLLTWAPPPRCIHSCLGPEQQTAFSCLPQIIQSVPLDQRRSWSQKCLELHRGRGRWDGGSTDVGERVQLERTAGNWKRKVVLAHSSLQTWSFSNGWHSPSLTACSKTFASVLMMILFSQCIEKSCRWVFNMSIIVKSWLGRSHWLVRFLLQNPQMLPYGVKLTTFVQNYFFNN